MDDNRGPAVSAAAEQVSSAGPKVDAPETLPDSVESTTDPHTSPVPRLTTFPPA